MAQMRRSQTNIQAPNQGLASIKNQSFNHQVSNIVSSQQGLDPFRGDLTNAFNNFFGGAQKAMATFQEAEMITKKQEAVTYADNMKKEAKAFATDKYMESPKMGTGDINVLVDGLDEEQRNNRHFLSTFKDTLGANIGDRMYGDFALHMVQRPASSFDSEALTWWEKNYGDGTGDPTVDTAMQAAWARNFEVARVKASGEAIKQQKQATLEEINNDVFRRVSQSNFNDTDWATISSNIASSFPNETTGQHQARALGMMMNASVQAGPAKTQKFLSFLDTVPEGEGAQSYAQRFPAAVAKIKAETYDQLLANTTLEGLNSYKETASMLAAIQSEPDEYTRFEGVSAFIATEIPKLMNTPGVPFQQIQTLKAEAIKEVLGLKKYIVNVNRLTFGATTGKWNPNVEVEDVQDYGHEALLREADWFNVDPSDVEETSKVMFNGSAMIKGMLDRFGEKSISDDTKQLFTAGLLSSDIQLQERTANILKGIDGSGELGRLLVAHDPRAAMLYDAVVAPNNANQSAQQALSVANSPEFSMAVDQINKEGVPTLLYPGEKPADAEMQFQEDFIGSNMTEFIEEQLGLDDGFLFFGNGSSPNLSPIVEDQVRKLAKTQLAKIRATGGDYDVETLRNSIYRTLAPALYIDDGQIKMNRGAENADERRGGIVPLGNSVYNPNSGEFENTATTLREDITNIQDGLIGLRMGEEILEDFDDNYFDIVRSEHLKHLNAYQIVSGSTGVPLTLSIGSEYEVNQAYSYDDEGNLTEKSWIMDWWDDTEMMTFTGDKEMDEMKASMVFGKGIALYPTTNLNGDVIGYSLVVRPRFQKGSEKWSIEDIERNAKSSVFTGQTVEEPLVGDDLIMP